MEPLIITNKDQLKALAAYMKAHAQQDDQPEDYYSNYLENPTLDSIYQSLSAEERKRLRDYQGGAAIVYNGRLLSLQLTKDDMHGHQWHLSMTMIAGPVKLAVPPDTCTWFVLEAFFSKVQAVPNPGKITQILHFVGND